MIAMIAYASAVYVCHSIHMLTADYTTVIEAILVSFLVVNQ